MPYHYANPEDEHNPYGLPIKLNSRYILIDYFTEDEMREAFPEDKTHIAGYMYCFCFPGCLPDSDWYGIFDSEEAALENARQLHGD
jgi:hypothetical protein